MPNSTSHVAVSRVGMQTDSHDLNMEAGSYSFALNAAIEDLSGNGLPQIQNDSSNVLAATFPEGYEVVGKKSIPELRRTIYALVNSTTNKSIVGEVKEEDYDDNRSPVLALLP